MNKTNKRATMKPQELQLNGQEKVEFEFNKMIQGTDTVYEFLTPFNDGVFRKIDVEVSNAEGVSISKSIVLGKNKIRFILYSKDLSLSNNEFKFISFKASEKMKVGFSIIECNSIN